MGAPLLLLLLLLLPPLSQAQTQTSKSISDENYSATTQEVRVRSPQLHGLSMVQYYLWGFAGTVVSGLGIAGNLLSIRVLLTPRMASSTSVYLVALASLDIVILLLFDTCMGLPQVSTVFAGLMQPNSLSIKVLYPLSLFIHMCSMYVTTCFTVERYMSIKFPFRSTAWCKRGRAVRVVIAILAFTALYNVPRALEKINFTSGILGPDGNVTMWNLEEDGLYQRIYHGFMYSVFMYVLPLLVLAVSNALLVHTVRLSTRRAQSSIGGKCEQQKRQDRDRSISLMLASVVVVFVFCQTFALVDNLLAVALRSQPPTHGQQAFYIVAQFMVVVNSSVNFLLYCFFGVKFRRALRSLFSQQQPHPTGASQLQQQPHTSNNNCSANKGRARYHQSGNHDNDDDVINDDEEAAPLASTSSSASVFDDNNDDVGHRLGRLRRLRRLRGDGNGEDVGHQWETRQLLCSESAASSSVVVVSTSV